MISSQKSVSVCVMKSSPGEQFSCNFCSSQLDWKWFHPSWLTRLQIMGKTQKYKTHHQYNPSHPAYIMLSGEQLSFFVRCCTLPAFSSREKNMSFMKSIKWDDERLTVCVILTLSLCLSFLDMSNILIDFMHVLGLQSHFVLKVITGSIQKAHLITKQSYFQVASLVPLSCERETNHPCIPEIPGLVHFKISSVCAPDCSL